MYIEEATKHTSRIERQRDLSMVFDAARHYSNALEEREGEWRTVRVGVNGILLLAVLSLLAKLLGSYFLGR